MIQEIKNEFIFSWFLYSVLKCSICHKKSGKHKPKENWQVSGLLCSSCYDEKYKNDSESIINKPSYVKVKKIIRSKWWIVIGASLLMLGILLA